MDLNPLQQQAVQYFDGPLLVLAGAGSGKTRVITQKITTAIETKRFPGQTILAITFTNKAAREMTQRVQKQLPKTSGKILTISTFHTFGLQFLKKHHKHVGLKPNFSLLDEADRFALLKALLLEDGQGSDAHIATLANHISMWKNNLILPEIALSTAVDPLMAQAAQLYRLYQRQLASYHAVDFDDLIAMPVYALRDEPLLEAKLRQQIGYILVDEYQDTNSSQYILLKSLAGEGGKFCVVGDDDQSIYSWRGADPQNLLGLKADYPTLKIIPLEQNYRSSNVILRSANALIANNPHLFEKTLWSAHGEGDRISIFSAEDDRKEAENIAHRILAHQFQKRTNFSDYAVLYRSNHQSRLVEEALRTLAIPYVVQGGPSFFAQPEIKDYVAYLRLLTNQDDDRAFIRAISTPKREIGPITLEKLSTYAKSRDISLFSAALEFGISTVLPANMVSRLGAFCEWILRTEEAVTRSETKEALQTFFAEIGYEDYLRELNLTKPQLAKKAALLEEFQGWFLNALEKANTDLNSLLQKMQLMDILERGSQNQTENAVTLLTIHAAKGLEFPYVFLIGCEEGTLPHQNSIDSQQIEEERRLCYVAITRAKETLTLSYSKTRKRFGESFSLEPSRFLDELPAECLVREDNQSAAPEPTAERLKTFAELRAGLLGG